MGEHPETLDPLLGSLDLLDSNQTQALWGTERAAIGGTAEVADTAGGHAAFVVADGEAQLTIMNPPYVRNTSNYGGAAGETMAAFAAFGISDSVKEKMGNRLNALRKLTGSVGKGHAGGSDFVGLAHQKTGAGGTIALVLPETFVSSSSWGDCRKLLLDESSDPIVIAHSDGSRSFSADTGMAEVLVLANKAKGNGVAKWVTLKRRPRTIVEAVEFARIICESDDSHGELRIGTDSIGVYVKSSMPSLSSNTDVAIAAQSLRESKLKLPQGDLELPIPIVQLGTLGSIGPDSSAIGYSIKKGVPKNAHTRRGRYAGPFQISDLAAHPTYPALWNHSGQNTLFVSPDSAAVPHVGEESEASKVWIRSSGSLHLNLEFRFTSQALAACCTDPCIGGQVWPTFACSNPDWEEVLCLWANSTFGILGHWATGSRQHNGRSRMSIKRITQMPVINCKVLELGQVEFLKNAFGRFKGEPLEPAMSAWNDKARIAIDDAILEAFGCNTQAARRSLRTLSRQWCEEPTVCGANPQA